MTDLDIIERVSRLFGISHASKNDRRNASWKPSYSVQLRGQRAVDLMLVLRPLMGERRRAQIDAAISSWSPQSVRINRTQAEEIMRRYHAGESAPALAECFR